MHLTNFDVIFSLSLNLKYFLILLWLLWFMDYLVHYLVLFNFQIFEEFCRYLVTDFYFAPILFRQHLEIQSLEIYWDLFYGLVYDPYWGMPHMHLRSMCILLLLDGMLDKCKLDQVIGSIVWIFYILTNLSIYQLQREESYIPQLWFSFSSVSFCFTYFGALLLGTATFRFLCLLD